MDKCREEEIPIALGTKLCKEDDAPKVDSTLYKWLVCSLMYLTTICREFCLKVYGIPKDSQWKVGKIILRYVAGTINYGLWYTTPKDHSFTSYMDSDFVGKIDDTKSTSRYTFHLGENLISWESKKYPIISISFAKYVVETSTLCHAIWLRRLLNDLAHMEKGSNSYILS